MVCCRTAFSETCLFSWLIFIQSSFNSSLPESYEYFGAVVQEAYRPIGLDVFGVSLFKQNYNFCFIPTVRNLFCLWYVIEDAC